MTMTAVRTKIYSVLDAYVSNNSPSSGGYIEDSRITSDTTRLSSTDEDIPIGKFYKGSSDDTLRDYLSPIGSYTDLSTSSLRKKIDAYYKATDAFKRTPNASYEPMYAINRIIEDIESEPAVLEAFGWDITKDTK